MSVREGLLAILMLGPAYGLQLHAEFMSRAPHRKAVNVGQIYGTLERQMRQGLIEAAGVTDDGLPLYALTASGRVAAARWMSEPETAALPEWTEMLDQVLVGSSVDPVMALELAKRYRRWWEDDLGRTRLAQGKKRSGADAHEADLRLALLAREAQGVAALAWLSAVISELTDFDSVRELSPVRPRRGRRPKA